MERVLTAIGTIETPYTTLAACPRNIEPAGPDCRLVIRPEFVDGIMGLAAGQEILILYWFENVDRDRLRQTSRRTGEYAGVFALRSPARPNPIGAAVVRISRIEGSTIHVPGLDCLSGTPLIDIKPAREGETTGRESAPLP